MPATAVRKTKAGNVALHTERGSAEPSKRHATCAWCGRDWRSIVELIDHVEAAHLDHTDTASHASGTRLTEEV